MPAQIRRCANHGSPPGPWQYAYRPAVDRGHLPGAPFSLNSVARSRLLRARDHQSGHGLHVTTDRTIAIGPGLAIFVPPGVAHEYRDNDGARVYNCLFRAELIDAELMWARRDPVLGSLFDPDSLSRKGDTAATVLVPLDAADVRRVIEALEPIRTGEATSRAAQLAHLLLALDIVARSKAAIARDGDLPSASSSLCTVAIELMTRDLAFPWTLDELSRRLFVGRFHLARTFARSMGDPPMHYLARLRAERAAAMLGTTDLPVATIGMKVGWPDPAYCSRRFRATFGMSPARIDSNASRIWRHRVGPQGRPRTGQREATRRLTAAAIVTTASRPDRP